MMDFVSWDDDIPNIWKNKIRVPNHQPGDNNLKGNHEHDLLVIWAKFNMFMVVKQMMIIASIFAHSIFNHYPAQSIVHGLMDNCLDATKDMDMWIVSQYPSLCFLIQSGQIILPDYPLLFNIAMENCPFIDVFLNDLPIKNGDPPYLR